MDGFYLSVLQNLHRSKYLLPSNISYIQTYNTKSSPQVNLVIILTFFYHIKYPPCYSPRITYHLANSIITFFRDTILWFLFNILATSDSCVNFLHQGHNSLSATYIILTKKIVPSTFGSSSVLLLIKYGAFESITIFV